MKVLGFNFDNLSVEKLKARPENLKINTSIDISEIKEMKNEVLKTKEEILQATFVYSVKYEPGFAAVELRGSILLSLDEKLAKDVLKEWKKKKMPEGFRTTLFNIILRKATVRSLQLEDELNLPLHMPLPTIRPGSQPGNEK